MKIAYLILAHGNPNHLKRLIKSLASPSSFFFVHIDKKVTNINFTIVEDNNIFFIQERIPVFWGDFSMVEATVNLIRFASVQENFDRFVLLSGADYSLVLAENIELFFRNNRDKEYINLLEMTDKKIISRLTNYQFRFRTGKTTTILNRVMTKAVALIYKVSYKDVLFDLIPYKGSSWWAITQEAVDYILKFMHENPHIVNFFKNTFCPDEMFFQIILGNSIFKSRITGNLTYTDWSAGKWHPENISEKHLPFFASEDCDKLFARKFADNSEKLISMIDEIKFRKKRM